MKKPQSDYSRLLRDPRWQKKRLEILQRDDFTCQSCEDKESTLHVHHLYYERGKMPWEYDDISLKTPCEDCHKREGDDLKIQKENLFRALALKGCGAEEINCLAVDIFMSSIERFDERVIYALAFAVQHFDVIEIINELRDEYMNRKTDEYNIGREA